MNRLANRPSIAYIQPPDLPRMRGVAEAWTPTSWRSKPIKQVPVADAGLGEPQDRGEPVAHLVELGRLGTGQLTLEFGDPLDARLAVAEEFGERDLRIGQVSERLRTQDAEAIHAWLIARANEDWGRDTQH